MIFKSEFSEPMKKSNKSNLNLTGIKRNFNSGPLLANKKNKITLSFKNTERKMMLKSDNLIFRSKSWLWKSPENSKNSIRKSHPPKQAKFNWTRLQNNSKKNMIKDTFSSPNGRKSPKQLLTEIKTLTESDKILLLSWIKSMPIKKPLTKEKNNLKIKRNSIVKIKLEMFWGTETSVKEKTNLRDFSLKELQTCRLKCKFWKISFHHFRQNSLKPEMELHSRIKIFCKKSKDSKLNRPNLMPFKQSSKTNFCSSKGSMSQKAKLKQHLRKRKVKGRKLSQTFPYKKIFWSETLKIWLNWEKMKLHSTARFKESWLHAETFSLTSTNWIKSSKSNKSSCIMPSIRFSWWNVKWREPEVSELLKKRKTYRKMFKLPKRNTMKSQNNTRFWTRV